MRITAENCEEYGERCAICGETATASWQGFNAVVAVCRDCALDVLPALIADAVADPVVTTQAGLGRLKWDWDRAGAAFWRGVAHATVRILTEERRARGN